MTTLRQLSTALDRFEASPTDRQAGELAIALRRAAPDLPRPLLREIRTALGRAIAEAERLDREHA